MRVVVRAGLFDAVKATANAAADRRALLRVLASQPDISMRVVVPATTVQRVVPV